MTLIGISWRRKRRQPSWWVMVGLLCLAIGSSIAVVVAFSEVVLKPLPGDHPERVVSMGGLGFGDGLGDPIEWWHVDGLEQLARYTAVDAKCDGPSINARWIRVSIVSGAVFEVFNQRPVLGRTLNRTDEFDSQRVAVLREDLWQSVRGSASSVNDVRIRLNGHDYAVVGTVPMSFRFPSESQAWVSETKSVGARLEFISGIGDLPPVRSEAGWVGRLRPDSTVTQLRSQLLARLHVANATRSPISGVRYGEIVAAANLQDRLTSAVRPHLTILLICAGIMLLLAIANGSVYAVTMAIERRGEVALKLSLGARPSTIYRELVAETVLMAGLCLAGSLLCSWGMLDLSRWLLFAFRVYLPPFAVVLPAILALSIVTTMVVCVIAMIPVVVLMRSLSLTSVVVTLAGGGNGATRLWLRRLVAGSAAAISTLLISGAVVADHSFTAAIQIPLGHESRRVMATRKVLPRLKLEGERFEIKRHELMRAVNAVGAEAAIASVVPITEATRSFQMIRSDVATTMAAITNVDGPFFRVMKIPIIAGQVVESLPAHAVVVSRTLAETLWGNISAAIGQSLAIAGPVPSWQVVAVADDSRAVDQGIHRVSALYMPFAPTDVTGEMIGLEVLAACPSSCAQTFTRVVDAVREVPDGYVGRSDTIANLEWTARANVIVAASVWSLFAIVAGLLSILASTTLAAQSITQRRIEIGVRGALGATPRQLTQMLTRTSFVSVAVGAVIGIAGAQALIRIIESVAEGVQPPRFLVVLLAGVTVTIAGTLAAFVLARNASRRSVAALLKVQ